MKFKVIYVDCFKLYFGFVFKSWFVEREGIVVLVEFYVVRVGEVGFVSGFVEVVLGESMLDGSDVIKFLNFV